MPDLKITAKSAGKTVITVKAAETESCNAASKTVIITVKPTATSIAKAENLSAGVKLTWKKNTSAGGYRIYRGSKLIKTVKSNKTVTFTDTAAKKNGAKYTYKIVAYKTVSGTVYDAASSPVKTVYYVARPKISLARSTKAGTLTLKWSKNKQAGGYQIEYALNKGFTKGKKTVTVKSAATVKKVLRSLAKGKKYYVRIRSYKTAGGTKYVSAWSDIKSVKVKKK